MFTVQMSVCYAIIPEIFIFLTSMAKAIV